MFACTLHPFKGRVLYSSTLHFNLRVHPRGHALAVYVTFSIPFYTYKVLDCEYVHFLILVNTKFFTIFIVF